MASTNPQILSIVVLLLSSLWNTQVSSSSNTTISSSSLFPSNISGSMTNAYRTIITLSSSLSALPTSSQVNGSELSVSSLVEHLPLKTVGVEPTINATSTFNLTSTNTSSNVIIPVLSLIRTSTATIVKSSNQSATTNHSTTALEASTSSTFTMTSTVNGSSNNSSHPAYMNSSTSVLGVSSISTTVHIVSTLNSTVSLGVTNASSYYSMKATNGLNLTRSSVSNTDNITASTLHQTLTVTPTSILTFSLNDSLSITPTESLSNQRNLSTSTNGSIQKTAIDQASSAIQSSRYSSATEPSSNVSLISSHASMNATKEIKQTSLINVMPSPLATMATHNSTTVSIVMSTQDQTITPSVIESLSSVPLLPLSTSTNVTVNETNSTVSSSSQTDDIIVMSYTTPCYITYIITQTINETSQSTSYNMSNVRLTAVTMETSGAQPITVVMETSSVQTTAATMETSSVQPHEVTMETSGVQATAISMETSLFSATVSSTEKPTGWNTSKLHSTTESPMVTMTSSKMSITQTLTSIMSGVMATPFINQTSSSILPTINTISRDVEQYSSVGIQDNTTSTDIRLTPTVYPTAVPSIDNNSSSIDNSSNIVIKATPVMTSLASNTSSSESNISAGIKPTSTFISVNKTIATSSSIPMINPSLVTKVAETLLNKTASSVTTEAYQTMNDSSSVSMGMTALPKINSTSSLSANITSMLNHTSTSSNHGNTIQISRTHALGNTTTSMFLIPGVTVTPSSSFSALGLGTPSLANTISNNMTSSTSVNTSVPMETSINPSSVQNNSSVSTNPNNLKRRRRRAAVEFSPSNSSDNSSTSAVNNAINVTVNGLDATVLPSSASSTSSSFQVNTKYISSNTSTDHFTISHGNKTTESLISPMTTLPVLGKTATASLNTSITSSLMRRNWTSESTTLETANATTNSIAAVPPVAMTTLSSLSQTPAVYLNTSSSTYTIQLTSSVAVYSPPNVTSTSISKVSTIMIQAPNSSGILLKANKTLSVSSSTSVNQSSTAPSVTIAMTTSSITITSETNTSHLNATEVPWKPTSSVTMATSIAITSLFNATKITWKLTSSVTMATSITNTSLLNTTNVPLSVSPTMASKSLNVTPMSSSVRLNQSQVASPTTSPTFFTTLTPTPIHPTPQLMTLTPSQATVVMESFSEVTSNVQSSSTRKNIFLTTSSLGICYVVYTTRIMRSSVVPSPYSVTGLNQTTPYNMSTKILVKTSYMVVSSTTPIISKSLVMEMNSTILSTIQPQTTASTINTSVSSSPIIVQPMSSFVQVNATSKLYYSTQSSGYVLKSVAVNATSLSPIATSVPSAVSMATTNSTVVHPSTPSSSFIQVVSSFQVINSSSMLSSPTSTISFTSSHKTSVVVSPSNTSVVMTTSSVEMTTSNVVTTTSSVVIRTSSVMTTLPPTTIPPVSTLNKVTIQIPRDIDVQSADLRRNVSKGLEEAFNTANNARRRRRATEGTEAKIYNITRKPSPSLDAVVLYSITRNGQVLSANEAVAVYDKTANLSTIGVWKVVRRPEPLVPPTPPPPGVLVSMIFEKIVQNLSVANNKKSLEDKLASYYKSRKSTPATVTATIHVIVPEKTGNVYIQFYVTEDGKQVPGATVVKVFEVEHLQQLTAYLQEQVIVGPYTDESLKGKESDYVQTRIAAPQSTNLQDSDFRKSLGDKLALAYISGKAKNNARRKRRAVGSVSSTIVNVTAVNGSRGFADVIFFIFDSGKVANATYAAAIFNRLTINEMSIITSPYAVITSPRPVVVPIVTETPPVTIAPVVIPYWIIGAVLGPIFLIIIIILLIYWRWKSGAPHSKIQPAPQKTPDYLRKTRMLPMQTHDVVRYAEGKPAASKIANMSVYTERSYENLPRRETSLRRKVPKASMQKRADMSRTNAAYDESEEDEDYDDSFITVSSTSHGRIVKAQPGPTVKDTHTHSVPVRSTPRKTPQKILEEETESDSSESEPESIGTTRTDQTRFSAAQVPTVAVMAPSSGNQPQVPVRFRSSVHPVPTLPPIHNKQTSLVGVNVEPSTDDQEGVTPRKTKRRSKAAQQELKQKADMERLRNKKRQREKKNKVTPVQSSDRRAWARNQLEEVLDPRPIYPFSRSKRRKPHRSKRADSVATDEDAIELKSYKRHPEDSMKKPRKDEEETEDQSEESSDDSSISMEETRKRMHTLLDDAFSLLGPLSQKQKQRPQTLEGPGDYYHRPPVPARYAGSRPALPEPAPAHGRATEPTPRQKRRLGNTGGFPHGLPQTPIGPGYPVRPPVRPPLVTSDPVVVWDPYDRQRYINQRMGFPQQGPHPTYSYTDPQGQNVYITPVQQQRDYMGGPIWSPYTAEDTMEDLYPDLAKSNFPGALGTSPPKDPYRDVTSRDTVIDVNDQFNQRSTGLGQAPQPLIRSIKDELMRLSNGGVRRTNITEL